MTLTRYEPWAALTRLQEDLNRLLEGRWPAFGDEESRVVTSQWVPPVDIIEESDRFVLRADVPGVKPEDIEVTVENGMLTIKGERKEEHDERKEGYRRIERVHGTFYRRFSLPDTADLDRIQAKDRNGVLEVVIPKKQEVQPRRIAVAA